MYNFDYDTSEEFFLYKSTVDKWTFHHFSRQNELLTGTLHSYDALALFFKILISDWLDDVIQSTAPYVTISFRER